MLLRLTKFTGESYLTNYNHCLHPSCFHLHPISWSYLHLVKQTLLCLHGSASCIRDHIPWYMLSICIDFFLSTGILQSASPGHICWGLCPLPDWLLCLLGTERHDVPPIHVCHCAGVWRPESIPAIRLSRPVRTKPVWVYCRQCTVCVYHCIVGMVYDPIATLFAYLVLHI